MKAHPPYASALITKIILPPNVLSNLMLNVWNLIGLKFDYRPFFTVVIQRVRCLRLSPWYSLVIDHVPRAICGICGLMSAGFS